MSTPITVGHDEHPRFAGYMRVLCAACVLDSTEREMSVSQKSAWKTRLMERDFPDRSFNIEFWQEAGDEDIFVAEWEMVELA